jgi:hypothetical protein
MRAAYLLAKSSYTKAIDLTEDPTALPALHANRVFVAARLGEHASAASDYEMAAHLETGALRRASLRAAARERRLS